MLVDEVGFEDVFVVKQTWTEGAIEVSAANADELVVMRPADLGGNKQAVVAAEED
jgi:hypothetical protein